MKLFQTKPVAQLIADSAGDQGMKRELSALNLVSLGIGSVVGAGIFILTGTSAALYAGPAIVISFVISGLGCLFAGLCYAEFSTMIPVAGSAYTYAYATMGEFIAWIVGWDLILEYLFPAPRSPSAGRRASRRSWPSSESCCRPRWRQRALRLGPGII